MARERVRLVPGDYYQPDDLFEGLLRRNATAYLLAAIAGQHKQVLHNLRDTVLPPFAAALNGLLAAERITEEAELRENWQDVRRVQRNEHLEELIHSLPEVRALRTLQEAVGNWASRHHLDLPRLVDTALATVAAWHADPKRARWLPWNHYQVRRPEPFLPESGEPFKVCGWSPRGETKVEARLRMTTAVEAYLDQIESKVVALGWKPAPTKIEIKKHVEWLAQYQVDGLNITDIARQIGDKKDKGIGTVRKKIAAGIDSAGELIAGADWPRWKRPASKGGRPKARQ